MHKSTFFLLALLPALSWAQRPDGQLVKTEYTDFENDTLQLDQVEVSMERRNRLKMQHLTSNTEIIGEQQLVRAACCNLGESFTANPSVDVNYSDAATGARQIKLLGLSGTYVQMLTENVPNLRGAAIPLSLGFIPGPWMQSIQVSKGAASVRNGYESTTGQINIEYLKPQLVDQVSGNLYYDYQQKLEANLMASTHVTERFSHGVLLHVEDRQKEHDENHDTFIDMPRLRQWNGMYRWAYVSPRWISQFFVRGLKDERRSGQTLACQEGAEPSHYNSDTELYQIQMGTKRAEVQWKNALIMDSSRGESLALMLHGSWHDAEHLFGEQYYSVRQRNGYAQLMYETDICDVHNLSVGYSMNVDEYRQHYPTEREHEYSWIDGKPMTEVTHGLYAQYTYKPSDELSLIAGVRGDHSSRYGTFWTPRMHVKYSPAEWFSLRVSAGKGYRSPQPHAENVSLMATGRHLHVPSEWNYQQEEAWNYGLSAAFTLPVAGKDLELNAEYYYTDFVHQVNVNPYVDGHIFFEDREDTKSYSHTLQIDASYPLYEGLDLIAGFRFNDAQARYFVGEDEGVEGFESNKGRMLWRPLTPRYKGMVSLSYKTPLELWQFDVTAQFIGPQMLYDRSKSPSYTQLSAQVTREFQYFSIYLGGENLTGYKMKHPILHAENPWFPRFDATQIWGPIDGAMVYAGIRFKIERM